MHSKQFEDLSRQLSFCVRPDVVLAPAALNAPIQDGGLANPAKYPKYCRHKRYGVVSNKPIKVQHEQVGFLAIQNGKPYIFGGIYVEHFGHFISEFIHRLWIASHPDYADCTVLFVASKRILPPKPYFEELMTLFGVRRWKIIDSPTKVEQLVIAQQAKSIGAKSFAAYDRFLGHLINQQEFQFERVKFKKLAILRGHLNARRMVSENHLEAYLGEQGYEIFRPEKYPISQQLVILANAEQIIMSDGSAGHLFDLLPPVKARVFFLARNWFSSLGKTSVRHKVRDYHCYDSVCPLIFPINSKGKKWKSKPLLYTPLPEVVQALKVQRFLPPHAPDIPPPPYLEDMAGYAHHWERRLPSSAMSGDFHERQLRKVDRILKWPLWLQRLRISLFWL